MSRLEAISRYIVTKFLVEECGVHVTDKAYAYAMQHNARFVAAFLRSKFPDRWTDGIPLIEEVRSDSDPSDIADEREDFISGSDGESFANED
eukprot:jgi/Hompol1/3372/HPOL_006495-RA